MSKYSEQNMLCCERRSNLQAEVTVANLHMQLHCCNVWASNHEIHKRSLTWGQLVKPYLDDHGLGITCSANTWKIIRRILLVMEHKLRY